MVEELAFRGIASAAEHRGALGAYDQGEYPAGSGWSYTRYCVPRAHAAGLRLAESGPRLWAAFEDAHLKAALDPTVERCLQVCVLEGRPQARPRLGEAKTRSVSAWHAIARVAPARARRVLALVVGAECTAVLGGRRNASKREFFDHEARDDLL